MRASARAFAVEFFLVDIPIMTLVATGNRIRDGEDRRGGIEYINPSLSPPTLFLLHRIMLPEGGTKICSTARI
jgi:hypothetical protein